MARIRLEGLTKAYGDNQVVNGLDLEIPDGMLTVLVGPSGCGKTTTLRMIAGLVEPSSGRIWIGDRDVTWLEPRDRDVAMVFQNYALYPHLKVFDNIAFGLRARKTPEEVIRPKVLEVARLLGLEDLLDRKPRQLSGGQQQRVAIGRALVREPAAFLFDEPLSNLDAKLRVDMRSEIRRIQQEVDATVVYVTHDQEEAMALADQLVVMNRGKIEQIGTPQEVYDRPRTRFVASFIGSPSMNLIEGDLSEGRFTCRGVTLRVQSPLTGTVTIGIRPEALQPGTAQSSRIQATTEVVEVLGSRAVVTLRLPDGRPLKAVVDPRAASSLPVGGSVSWRVAPEDVHVFTD